jgi:hypothetical protein
VANEEHVHVALPKLFGAPAYARPKVTPVARADRPFDPDELPLESVQTEEERQLMKELTARPYGGAESSEQVSGDRDGAPLLRGKPFRLGVLTGRLRGGNGTGN